MPDKNEREKKEEEARKRKEEAQKLKDKIDKHHSPGRSEDSKKDFQ